MTTEQTQRDLSINRKRDFLSCNFCKNVHMFEVLLHKQPAFPIMHETAGCSRFLAKTWPQKEDKTNLE